MKVTGKEVANKNKSQGKTEKGEDYISYKSC